ncbi:MAG: hypothetical protein SGPRY_011534 [Prymnesium sp.]
MLQTTMFAFNIERLVQVFPSSGATPVVTEVMEVSSEDEMGEDSSSICEEGGRRSQSQLLAHGFKFFCLLLADRAGTARKHKMKMKKRPGPRGRIKAMRATSESNVE